MISQTAKLYFFLLIAFSSLSWVIDPSSSEFRRSVENTPKVTVQNYKASIDYLSRVSDLAKMFGLQRSLSDHCLGAEGICSVEQCSPILVFHSANIFKNLGCTNTLTTEIFEDQEKILREDTELKNFYSAFFTFIFSGRSQTAEKYCNRLSTWIPSQGLPRFKPRQFSRSLIPSRLLWEMNLVCKQSTIQDKLYTFFQ